MPSQLSHILFGYDALESLPTVLRTNLADPVFRLGCQGPDIFYHNRRTKPGAFLYGTRLHRRGWGTVLDRFRRQVLARGWGPDHPAWSFLAGQATHGFLDRALHPLVVYFSGWKVPRDPSTDILRHAHAFLERVHDVRLWEHRTGRPVTECRWQDDLPGPEAFSAEFWQVWADALHSEFPNLSDRTELEGRLQGAVSDTRGFLDHTSPSVPGNAVRAARWDGLHFVHPGALPDWDFLNLRREGWRDPVSGAERRESYLDLYAQALGPARDALAAIAQPGDDWQARIGNGSLNLPGSEGENLAPSHTRPWDYAELYERERRFRAGTP